MAKRRVGSQIGNLTPNHKKSGIALKWCDTYCWKTLDKDFKPLTSIQSKVCTQSYGPPKSWESQVKEFQDFNLGVLGQNDIWVLTPWLSRENIIKGKVMASPSLSCGEFCESVFARGLSMHQKCSNYALINLLFIFLQVRVNNWLGCHSS